MDTNTHWLVISRKIRICKPFKQPRNRFPAWRAGSTTLLDVPARQATQAGLLKRLQIRTLTKSVLQKIRIYNEDDPFLPLLELAPTSPPATPFPFLLRNRHLPNRKKNCEKGMGGSYYHWVSWHGEGWEGVCWLARSKTVVFCILFFYHWKLSNTYILQDPVHGIAAGVEQIVVHLHVGDELVNSALLHRGKDRIKLNPFIISGWWWMGLALKYLIKNL